MLIYVPPLLRRDVSFVFVFVYVFAFSARATSERIEAFGDGAHIRRGVKCGRKAEIWSESKRHLRVSRRTDDDPSFARRFSFERELLTPSDGIRKRRARGRRGNPAHDKRTASGIERSTKAQLS